MWIIWAILLGGAAFIAFSMMNLSSQQKDQANAALLEMANDSSPFRPNAEVSKQIYHEYLDMLQSIGVAYASTRGQANAMLCYQLGMIAHLARRGQVPCRDVYLFLYLLLEGDSGMAANNEEQLSADEAMSQSIGIYINAIQLASSDAKKYKAYEHGFADADMIMHGQRLPSGRMAYIAKKYE